MLVTITVIIILASLLLPALQNAVKTAEATSCANNFSMIGMAQSAYANENNNLIWHVGYKGALCDTWSDCLIGGLYIPQPSKYLDTNALLCPSTTIRTYSSHYSTYGMYRATTDLNYASKKYSFMLNSASPFYIYYRTNRIPRPCSFVMTADSFVPNSTTSSTLSNKPFYIFSPSQLVEGGGIQTLHPGERANCCFADGHVTSLDSYALRDSELTIKYQITSLLDVLILP